MALPLDGLHGVTTLPRQCHEQMFGCRMSWVAQLVLHWGEAARKDTGRPLYSMLNPATLHM